MGGDPNYSISVSSHGFSGHNETSIVGIRPFSKALFLLEENRKGEAKLESMSPGELELKVWAVDRSRHMAVEGKIGSFRFGASGTYFWHSLHFGFEFDPSRFIEAVDIS